MDRQPETFEPLANLTRREKLLCAVVAMQILVIVVLCDWLATAMDAAR